jgi:hypothetical protein
MSAEPTQRETLDATTRDQFEDLLYGTLISKESGHPNDKSYTLQDPCSAGDSLRVTVHLDAIRDSPLGTGDQVNQLYFEDLGIVILDLNPQEA